MKKQNSRKKKVVLTLVVAIVALLLLIGIIVYAIGRGFYNTTNYTSDESAMEDYVAMEDEEEVSPEDASGEVLTEEQEAELERQLLEFSEAEPITNDGNVYNVLLVD